MYLIPRNVVARFEFFPGFGWFELIAVVAGGLIGLVLFGLVSLFTSSLGRFVFIVAPPALAFFATKPGPDGQSFFSLVKTWQKYKSSQKRYLYRRCI